MTDENRPLWKCPECGEAFTTTNQWHSCGKFSLEALFARSDPQVKRLYERFVKLLEENGPVKVIPQKSRIAFQVRMRFAAIRPGKSSLRGHLILSRRREEPFFERVETLSRRNHVHEFRFENEDEMDEQFRDCIKEAYAVGEQRHLGDDA